MATPNYDKLRDKVLQWANRDKEVFGVTASNLNGWKDYIGDFLSYAADEAYRLLRIPPMEFERTYTIEQNDIVGNANISVLGTNNWAGTGGISYVRIPLPEDFIEMKSLRWVGNGTAATSYNSYGYNPGIVFNEVVDERTFFDIYAETYSNFYWMRKDNFLYVKPALSLGSMVALSYYRQLPALDSDYSVLAENYIFNGYDANGIQTPVSAQPFLDEISSIPTTTIIANTVLNTHPNRLYLTANLGLNEGDVVTIGTQPIFPANQFQGQVKVVNVPEANDPAIWIDTDMYFSLENYPTGAPIMAGNMLYFVSASGTRNGITYNSRIQAFDTQAAATTAMVSYATLYPTLTFTVTMGRFTGYELSNWLKDQNERILIWGALMNAGSFLDDEKIEARYGGKFNADINSLNHEERMRRAKGGNVQVHFNGRGLI